MNGESLPLMRNARLVSGASVLACRAGLDEAAVAEARRGRRRRARGGRRSPTRRGCRTRRTLELVEHRPHRDRRRDGHRRLEVLRVGPRVEPVVDDDRGVAAAGVEVLAHEQGGLAARGHHLRRRPPVDVAQVVTGDVLPQGVEGQVALADRRRSRRPRGRAAVRRRATRAAAGADAPAPRCTGVQTTSREKMPTGSPRRVIAGPTAITPRRSVRIGERLLVGGAGRERAGCRSGARPTRPGPRASSGPGARTRG